TVLHDRPAEVGSVGAAEDAHGEFGAAGSHETGDADDLAAAHIDARTLDDQALGDRRMLDDPILHLEEHLAELGSAVGVTAFERAADHPADDAILVDLPPRDVEGL